MKKRTPSILHTMVQPIEHTSESPLLGAIRSREIQNNFLDKRKHNSPADAERFARILASEECQSVLRDIAAGTHIFSIPIKKLVSKYGTNKKRTVYMFEEYEMMALRLIAQELYRYDHLFSDNLYSFRSGHGVQNAMNVLRHANNLGKMYGYKTDIHDYFNSIDISQLLPALKTDLNDDMLYDMFERILSDNKVLFNHQITEEAKGVMAGTPVSPFLANFYLKDMDMFFGQKDCIYMRYADDILILADSEEKLSDLRDELIDWVSRKGLEMNPKKEKFFAPGDTFDFLGFAINQHDIDISPASVEKMKQSIRRTARAIRRWMLEKNAPVKGTVKAMIRKYNGKFFGYDDSDELTWSRWYFSVITTDRSLHEIDSYLQEELRYVATGKHNKANYRTMPYSIMKDCGYRTLVNGYHSQMEG